MTIHNYRKGDAVKVAPKSKADELSVSYDVLVEETGEIVKVRQPASEALSSIRKRLDDLHILAGAVANDARR